VHSIYDEIIGIINRASEYVYIVTWHFKALNLLPEFTEALKQAIDRGVWVYLYSNTEQPNYSRPESLRQIEYLESIGCKSKGDDNNHSKCVISESEGVVFTANIDGVHGLKTGFEVGCVLQEEELDTAREYVEQIIGN
jgi:phosphatidylserine/phosphatidylglycerophosphate/cardiolipin synthase-like enzyme